MVIGMTTLTTLMMTFEDERPGCLTGCKELRANNNVKPNNKSSNKSSNKASNTVKSNNKSNNNVKSDMAGCATAVWVAN